LTQIVFSILGNDTIESKWRRGRYYERGMEGRKKDRKRYQLKWNGDPAIEGQLRVKP